MGKNKLQHPRGMVLRPLANMGPPRQSWVLDHGKVWRDDSPSELCIYPLFSSNRPLVRATIQPEPTSCINGSHRPNILSKFRKLRLVPRTWLERYAGRGPISFVSHAVAVMGIDFVHAAILVAYMDV